MPLMVHSIWRAPFCTAVKELAVAIPKSLWQCTEITALSIFGTRLRTSAIILPNWLGKQKPTVSGIFTVVAPALIAASTIRQILSIPVRPASSQENSTSSV